MSIVEDILERLKAYGYQFSIDWVDLNSIPETMRDGSVFVEVVEVAGSQLAFKMRSTSTVRPVVQSIRFSLINQRDKMTIDAYCDRLKVIVVNMVELDKAKHPDVTLVEMEAGPVLQDKKFYVYQFTLKITRT